MFVLVLLCMLCMLCCFCLLCYTCHLFALDDEAPAARRLRPTARDRAAGDYDARDEDALLEVDVEDPRRAAAAEEQALRRSLRRGRGPVAGGDSRAVAESAAPRRVRRLVISL